MREPFIEQTANGGWIYGWRYPRPWWKFWAKDRRSYYPARTHEEAVKGFAELRALYARLGVL